MKSTIEQLERRGGGNNGTSKVGIHPPKQGKQAQKWCFTLNNYTKDNIEQIEQYFSSSAKKYIFQEETSESGTPHLQGCFWLKKRRRITELTKDMIQAHYTVCRNWSASVAYCRKQETRSGDIFCKGIPRPIKVLAESQLFDWQKDLVEVVRNEPDDRKIFWYWESTGCVGKSTFCKYLVIKHSALILGGKSADMKYGIVKYKEKHGEYPRNIVIDIPRQLENYVSYSGLEDVKNACFYSGKYESTMCVGNNPNLIVFANFPPDLSAMSKDRWVIRNIGSGYTDTESSDDGI